MCGFQGGKPELWALEVRSPDGGSGLGAYPIKINSSETL